MPETTALAEGTTMAATTGGVEPVPTTTKPKGDAPTVLCSAESYAFIGTVAPSQMVATTTALGIKCKSQDGREVENQGATLAKTFYTSGAVSQTAENKKKCTDLGGTVTELTCGSATFLPWWVDMSMDEPRKAEGYLGACCGYPASFGRLSLVAPLTGGTYRHMKYSDTQCTTEMKGSDFPDYAQQQMYADGELLLALGTCHDLGYATSGNGYKWTACNATHYIRENYFDGACASKEGVSLGKIELCEVEDNESGDSTGNSTLTTKGTKDTCEGGAAPANMEVVTTGRTVLTGIPTDISEADKVKVVDTASETYRKAVMVASGNKPTEIESKSGTGNLAAAPSRRRLASRRLAGATEVITVTATTVPTAEAAAAKSSLDTATASGGALSAAVLGAEMVTAIKAEVATLTNITAVPAVEVSEPSIVVDDGGGSGGGGSTSSAVATCLGYGAGLALVASLMM